MASWGMARRVAELSVFGVQIAAGKRFSVRLPSRGSFHHLSQRLMLSAVSCFSSSSISASPHALSAASERSVGFPRPEEIQWQKSLVNNVSLIGRINKSVDITYLDSGKIVASTSILVNRRTNDTDYTEFILQFWDELAEIAAAHLKKEDRVYVAGSVWVESYMDNQSLSKSICKVVARDLKFVGPMQRTSIGEVGTEQEETRSVEDLWRDYFKSPSDFWDNRLSKKNIKGPDFRHKSTGAPLWIDSRSTPLWVHEEIDQAPSKPTKGEKAKEMEKLWQVFFADPLEWWDNRDSKKIPTYPDFKNKSSGEALWIESSTTPSWVRSQLELLDSKTKSLKEGGGQSEWQRSSKGRTPKTSIEDEDLMFF